MDLFTPELHGLGFFSEQYKSKAEPCGNQLRKLSAAASVATKLASRMSEKTDFTRGPVII
jgi:hypothetical protein